MSNKKTWDHGPRSPCWARFAMRLHSHHRCQPRGSDSLVFVMLLNRMERTPNERSAFHNPSQGGCETHSPARSSINRPLQDFDRYRASIVTRFRALQAFDARRGYARPLRGFDSHSSSIVTRLRAIQDFDHHKTSTATTSYSQLLLDFDRQ